MILFSPPHVPLLRKRSRLAKTVSGQTWKENNSTKKTDRRFVSFCFVLFHSFGILGRSNSDRLDAQSGQSYRESNVPHGAWDVKPLVQQGLRQQQKTFLERRGMMHSFKANLRVFTFYLALFQVIVTIAHDVPFQQDVLPLCPPQLQIRAQTPDEILNDMDRSYGPTCDLNTAMCQYLNTPSKFGISAHSFPKFPQKTADETGRPLSMNPTGIIH